MNRELMQKVRDRIAEVGDEGADMDSWIDDPNQAMSENECGTTACIAGWTVILGMEDWHQSNLSWFDQACDLLDINRRKANSMFYWNAWPQKFKDILVDEGHAKGMIAFLDAILDGLIIWDEKYRIWRHIADVEDEIAAEFDDAG